MSDYLKELFINEAKPALKRHSGAGGGELDRLIDGSITEITSNATSIKKDFKYYENLTTVSFLHLTKIVVGCFQLCENLTTANFSSATSIAAYAFNNCKKLISLILRGETVCTLSGTHDLTYTPIESGTGYIYVPRALVDSYKSATNWSAYASQFRALEDYTVDGTTTGALDESKI